MRIFLSSTYVDLKEIRKVAITHLEGIVGHVTDATGTVVAMEYFNATERYCKEECLHELSTCDLVIGIYGDRYGTPAEDGRSMTEIEFDYAIKHGIPILAFVKREVCRDEKQRHFISEKVHRTNKSCANFEGETDFAERLNNSLKNYLGKYDGYSVDSLWSQVSSLKEVVQKKVAEDAAGFELQMLPYSSGDEALAVETILHAAFALKGFVENLGIENDAVHPYAYKYTHSLDEVMPEDKDELCENVTKCSEEILRNWDNIHVGINNYTTAIILATAYLKLKRMQQRLLTETWSEKLRQEVVKVREEYLDTIFASRYVD